MKKAKQTKLSFAQPEAKRESMEDTKSEAASATDEVVSQQSTSTTPPKRPRKGRGTPFSDREIYFVDKWCRENFGDAREVGVPPTRCLRPILEEEVVLCAVQHHRFGGNGCGYDSSN